MAGGGDGPTGPTGRTGGAVRPMTAADAGSVLAIHHAGLDAGNTSFETTAPAWADFDAARLPAHRFVAVAGPTIT